jgi:PAS domain S-box-containing protein
VDRGRPGGATPIDGEARLAGVLGVPEAVASTLAACLDSLPFYVLLVDAGHRILFVNQAARADLGLASAELFGAYCPQVVHGLGAPIAGCPLEEARAAGHLVERELRDPATGRWLATGVYPLPLADPDGQPLFLHSVRDVTRQRQVEHDVARERDMNAMVAEVLVLALEDAPLERVLDLVLERLLGIPWLSVETRGGIFLAEGDPPALVLKAQRDLPPWSLAECRTVPFGHCLCGRAAAAAKLEFADDVDARHEHCHPALPAHGHYCVPIVAHRRVLGVINLYLRAGHPRDSREEAFLQAVANVLAGIIERRRAEAQLRHSQKLEALGALAAGVAHDFNNLLTVIQGHADALHHDAGADAEVRRGAERIKATVRRAAALTRQLVTFGRREPARAEVLDVNAVVDEVRGMLAPLLGARIELQAVLGAAPGAVCIDRGQLEQVLMNLAVNARDAMPDGGRLTIATAPVELDAGSAPPGRYVALAVTDTGVGIPPELAARIFEPFYTTKPAGEGSGLGLAIVEGIVRQAGGHVRLASTPGQGSTFTVYLPAATAP